MALDGHWALSVALYAPMDEQKHDDACFIGFLCSCITSVHEAPHKRGLFFGQEGSQQNREDSLQGIVVEQEERKEEKKEKEGKTQRSGAHNKQEAKQTAYNKGDRRLSMAALHPGYGHELLRIWQSVGVGKESDRVVLPVFAVSGKGIQEDIPSLPGVKRFSADSLVEYLRPLVVKGLRSILVFGVVDAEAKTSDGRQHR